MKHLKFVVFLSFAATSVLYAQDPTTTTVPAGTVSQVFEEKNPKDEVIRLEGIRANLTTRLQSLSTDPGKNAEEITRVQGMIRYVDVKITRLEKIILSEEYAEKTGAPEKEGLTDEEYYEEKIAWKDSISQTTQNMQIKTVLTRYEFEKLPKDRQEKILSMPERYTIID